MLFHRNSVRLNTDVYGAYRYLTVANYIEKWWHEMPEKVHGEPYEHVDWVVKALDGRALNMTFHMMRCATKTEYCTEIHLVIPFEQHTDKDSETYLEIQRFGAHVLERLRVHFNKNWVITDKDLSLGELRQSL